MFSHSKDCHPLLRCFTLDLFHHHHCRLFASGSYPFAQLRNLTFLLVPTHPKSFLAPLFLCNSPIQHF